jgi:hypothetical protein
MGAAVHILCVLGFTGIANPVIFYGSMSNKPFAFIAGKMPVVATLN